MDCITEEYDDKLYYRQIKTDIDPLIHRIKENMKYLKKTISNNNKSESKIILKSIGQDLSLLEDILSKVSYETSYSDARYLSNIILTISSLGISIGSIIYTYIEGGNCSSLKGWAGYVVPIIFSNVAVTGASRIEKDIDSREITPSDAVKQYITLKNKTLSELKKTYEDLIHLVNDIHEMKDVKESYESSYDELLDMINNI